jgi:hypothetical protein
MKVHFTVFLACLLLCLATSVPVLAQVNATLTGTVSDASSALIPGVLVTAKNNATGIVTTHLTNESGNYDFPSLQPGTYVVTASLTGFQSSALNDVSLGQGQQVRLNFKLKVAAAGQTVEVVEAADTLLAATSASVGNVLPDAVVSGLPLSSRNVLDLVGTTPGVVTTVNAFGGNVQSFGGTPFSQVNTTRDGLVTNDGRYNNSNGAYSAVYTSPDMVEEVRITANNVDPALGRGSAQVQMRTRAGGNSFHGALFYTNNNSALSTNTWFQNANPVPSPKSYTNRNQFGGRLGGPIIKNKAFFFVLVDNQRYMEKQDFVTTVLTNEARQGIFRYLTEGSAGGTSRQNGNANGATPSVTLGGQTLTVNPTNGNPLFLNSFNLFTDVNDPNRPAIDPVWFGPQNLTRLPLPNDWTVGDGLNTAGFRWRQPHAGLDGATGQSQNTNRNALTLRFDYQLNEKNKLTFTMSREKDWGVTGQTGLPDVPAGEFGDVKRVPDFYTASWTSTLSSTILNEFRFGLKRDTWQGTSPLDKGCCWNGSGPNDVVDSSKAMRDSFPNVGGQFAYVTAGLVGGVNLGNYAPFGVASPRQSISPFQQWSDTISFTRGAHAFQAGGEIDFASSHQFNHGGQQTTRPFVTLGIGAIPVPISTASPFAKGINASDVTTSQNLLANLSGTVASIQEQYFVNSPTATDWTNYQTNFIFQRDLHENDWDFFFKDTWKASQNLTLNLGVRYDKYGVPYDTTGLGGRFTGGQSALFGCSGKDFNVWWAPGAGNCNTATPTLTTTEFVGKDSPNPGKTFWGNDWNNFAPSIGFSYKVPWLAKSTIVRGGYGINFAGAADYLAYSGNIGNLPGQTLNVTYNSPTYLSLSGLAGAGVIPVPTGGAQPFTAVPLTNRTAGITGYADKRVTPYVQSFNLSIQRELAHNTTLDISWIGNKATKLFSATQLNETNIFENGILDAFNITRAGGDSPLFNQMLLGLNVTGVGVVNGTTITGSQALRKFATTNTFIANGDVGGLANYLNTTNNFTGVNGGILRNGGLPENFIVVNPQFGSVSLEGNNSSSTYHSFQTVLTRRITKGLYTQFSYTFSKALGDNGVRDPRNRQLSKGLLSIDRPQVVKANGTYELPFGTNHAYLNGAPNYIQQIVGNWELSSVFSWVTGSPLSFTGINTLAFRAQNTADLVGALPDNLGKVEKTNGVVQYFSGLKFANAPLPNFGTDATLPGRFTNKIITDLAGNTILQNPQPGTTGNTALNLPGLRGPSNLGMDVALNKKFVLTEGKTFSIRADAVNILNTPVWGNPSTNINSTNFGKITTSGGARTVTISARIDF